MSIAPTNDRLTVIIPKSLKEELKVLADKENRSVSNYVVYILENHVETKGIRRDTNIRNTSQNEDKFYVDINLPDK